MEQRMILCASEGKVLTNGTIYGRKIYLAEGMSAGAFYEISEDEYEELLAAEENEVTYGKQ